LVQFLRLDLADVTINNLLQELDQFESDEMLLKRQNVLKELEEIINKWVFFLSCKMGKEIDESKYACAKIFPFGS